MCYKVSQAKPPKAYSEYYRAPIIEPEASLPEHTPYYQANGFAHPSLAVITGQQEERALEFMKWGLLPPAAWGFPMDKAILHSNNTLNAKSETIWEVKSFRSNIGKYRCILPVEGFFEYKHVGGDKLPYFIHPKEKPFFNLACVFGNYRDPSTGIWIKSFGIITGAANELMADIHNTKFRQPIILDDEQVSAWLDPKTDEAEINLLMEPCNDSLMSAYRVNKDLQKIGNDKSVLQQIEQ